MRNVSLAEMRAAGVTLDANESVAITQLLIKTPPAAHDPEAEYTVSAPSSDNVFLNADGSVWCRGGKPMRSASDAGIFLHALLPAGSPRVLGDLRHTIACALLSVEMPGVDALDEFSSDLTRFERGDRADVVRRVLARAGITVIPVSRPLRRRDAGSVSAAPIRGRVMTTAAACVIGGLALIASGGSTRGRAPIDSMTTVQAMNTAAASTTPAAIEPPLAGQPGVIPPVVAWSRTGTVPGASRPRVRRASTKRVTRPATGTAAAPPRRRN